MHELLHPPGHRGPVIASGGMVLTLGVALTQLRMDWAPGVQLAVAAALAATLLWFGVQEDVDGPPPAYATVLLVAGLLALLLALTWLADLLGAPVDGGVASGTVAWIAAVWALAAAVVARRRRSSVAVLFAAGAAGVAVIGVYDELFDPRAETPFRWLLLALTIAYVLGSLVLRGRDLRHSEQLVNAAGLAVAGIWIADSPLIAFGFTDNVLWWWEAVVLAGGLGLIAYAAVDRAPGPGYLGALNLIGFLVVATGEEETLLLWPALLLVAGAVLLVIGLRPRVPLPPSPDASTAPGDQPLSARTGD